MAKGERSLCPIGLNHRPSFFRKSCVPGSRADQVEQHALDRRGPPAGAGREADGPYRGGE